MESEEKTEKVEAQKDEVKKTDDIKEETKA